MSLLCSSVGPGCLHLHNALPTIVLADMLSALILLLLFAFFSSMRESGNQRVCSKVASNRLNDTLKKICSAPGVDMMMLMVAPFFPPPLFSPSSLPLCSSFSCPFSFLFLRPPFLPLPLPSFPSFSSLLSLLLLPSPLTSPSLRSAPYENSEPARRCQQANHFTLESG